LDKKISDQESHIFIFHEMKKLIKNTFENITLYNVIFWKLIKKTYFFR